MDIPEMLLVFRLTFLNFQESQEVTIGALGQWFLNALWPGTLESQKLKTGLNFYPHKMAFIPVFHNS